MTIAGLGLGLLAGLVEMYLRGPTPGGGSLWAMVLGADAALGFFGGWLIAKVVPARGPDVRLRWVAIPLFAVILGAQAPEARHGAQTLPSPAKAALAGLRGITDLDRDGSGVWLGEHDCAPLDSAIRPGAAEIPGNGVDDNCLGGDLSSALPPPESQEPTPWPPGLNAAGGGRPRNLLLITVDSLRADHVGAYGYERATTPVIDSLAKSGALFERAYSHTPATRWSLPMIHTSLWPSEIPWDRSTWPHRMRDDVDTLAERLRRSGVRTGAVWSFRTDWGLKQGFEFWEGPPRGRRHRSASAVPAAKRFLDQDDGRPWFLWVHLFDPHLPYRPPASTRLFGDGPMARYDGEILSADQTIGRLLRSISAGRAGVDDTAVVVTSDHGEEFRDHGGYAHRDRLFEELIRVPLIVSLPGVEPRRTSSAAGLLDVAPTVLDLFGVAASGRGRSLVGDAIGLRESPERPIFASLAFFPTDPSQSRAVISGDFKLIFDPMSGRRQTYDLKADPRELRDRAALLPGRTRDLMELLVPFIERTSAP